MATEHTRCDTPHGRRIAVAMGVEIHQQYEELEARWDWTRDPAIKAQLQAMDSTWRRAYHEERLHGDETALLSVEEGEPDVLC